MNCFFAEHSMKWAYICCWSKWNLPGEWPYTVKRTSTIFWLSQLHSFCAHDTKFKECLEFERNVVEKLPTSVILVSPFRKPKNQDFYCFFGLAYLLIESSLVAWLWLKIPCRNATKQVFRNKRKANVTKEKLLNGLSRKPAYQHFLVTLMQLRQPENMVKITQVFLQL